MINFDECGNCKRKTCRSLKVKTKKVSLTHKVLYTDSGYGEDDVYGDVSFLVLYRHCKALKKDIRIASSQEEIKRAYNKYGEDVNWK